MSIKDFYDYFYYYFYYYYYKENNTSIMNLKLWNELAPELQIIITIFIIFKKYVYMI